MEIYIVLSRENITLPKSEVKAVLESEKIPYQIEKDLNGILIIEIPDNESYIEILGKRLGYVHEIVELLFETDIKNLYSAFEKFKWKDYIKNDYAIRVKKINFSGDIDSQKNERDLGRLVGVNLDDARVNLKNPETYIRVTFTDEKILIGIRKIKIDKKHFFNIKPHKRPFFYPGSMSPKLARCMVNLSRINEGDIILDPFCGTGGILIEAGIIGARVLGVDIDEKMVNGTIKNLRKCKITNYNIVQGDARYIELDGLVDSIVTDPPYGISASTAGEESIKLYRDAIFNMQNLLKTNGHLCLATPHYVDVNQLIRDTKFIIKEKHEIRMHKSLTRIITVLENLN
ncbi:MAG: TIGR01177 family methyltransferase [Methanobacteriaceae archaeon]|nr:TIGR01177 family methyltransferase [Methanobacteriaceae archaeon]